MDQYTVSKVAYGSTRDNPSCFGVIFGIILFIASFYLLSWNEGRAVYRAKTLAEGRGIVRSIETSAVNAQNNNALVHLSGIATTKDILNDTLFGVSENALKLNRIVEMYQWEEDVHTNHNSNQTQGTTYTYNKVWSSIFHPSAHFKFQDGHVNPTSMPYSNLNVIASDVEVQAFHLSSAFIEQINAFRSYNLSDVNYGAMSDQMKAIFKLGDREYNTGNPSSPQIGDMRVRFQIITPLAISAVGKQNNNTLDAYYIANDKSPSNSMLDTGLHTFGIGMDHYNASIALLEYGDVSARTMFADAEEENALKTWGLRLLGIFIMWLGLRMVCSPILTLANIVPYVGALFESGVSMGLSIIVLILGTITIAISWLSYRPIVACAICVLAFGFLGGGLRLVKIRSVIKGGKQDATKEVVVSSV